MSETPMMSDKQMRHMLKQMGKTLAPAIEATAREAVAGLSRVDRKHGILPGAPAPGKAPARERAYQFLKAALGGDQFAMKALAGGGTGAAGGYLVPEDFRAEVLMRLPDLAELAPHVRTVPVRTDTGSMPSLATDIAVTWSAGGAAENEPFNESEPVMGTVTWSLKRADAITKMSRELVNDAGPSVVEFVTRLFQEAIASERDRMIAAGAGTTEPTGLANTAGLPALTSIGALDFATLVEMEQTLPRKYRAHGRWVMNSKNLQRVYSLADEQGQPIFLRDMVGGVPESRILGYPVSQNEALADGEIYFGNLSYYLWFDREEMGVESTTVGGDAFARHQVWLKVWERADGKVGLPDAFVKGSGITG